MESWKELPQLLDKLVELSDDAIDQLQVISEGFYLGGNLIEVWAYQTSN